MAVPEYQNPDSGILFCMFRC